MITGKEKTLLLPISIGSVRIPNRVVFGAHTTNFAEENIPGERHRYYYTERAKGGAGLIVVEEGYVHESDFPYEYAILAYKQEVIAGYRSLAEAVHLQGSKIFAQLGHSGSQADSSMNQRELWSPSGFQTDAEVPKIMELEDIQAVVAGFAKSALHMKQAGIDGIELNGGQRSLIRQFMSGLTNLRNDQYGGSLENRLHFVQEIITTIRGEVGRAYPLGLRITVDEYAPWAGITPEQAEEMVRQLSGDGMLDFFSISVGSIYSIHMTRPSMHVPQGFAADYAERIKKATNLPVIGGGRIVQPEQAELFLNQGKIDLVEVTRGQISDPFWVNKYILNQAARIQPCIGCNQECQVYGNLNRKLSCVSNPAAGYEQQLGLGTVRKARQPKNIMIIGSGPAGLETARVAADRGHQVTIYEASNIIGGNLNLAIKGPGRGELGEILRYYQQELSLLGVKVQLNTEVNEELIAEIQPDEIVVATGSRPRTPYEFDGEEFPQVCTGQAVWNGQEVGEHVVIVDEVGNFQATSLIERLALEGKKVTVLTSELFVGLTLAQTLDISPWNQRVYALDVTMLPRMRIQKITGHQIYIYERFSKLEQVLEGIDSVVFCLSELPCEHLYLTLKGKYPRVHRVGDCVAPRGIGMSILEGNQVGRRL